MRSCVSPHYQLSTPKGVGPSQQEKRHWAATSSRPATRMMSCSKLVIPAHISESRSSRLQRGKAKRRLTISWTTQSKKQRREEGISKGTKCTRRKELEVGSSATHNRSKLDQPTNRPAVFWCRAGTFGLDSTTKPPKGLKGLGGVQRTKSYI